MRSRALILLCLMAFCAGCQRANHESSDHKPAGADIPLPADPASAAQISGVVSFEGTPPKPIVIDMSADSGCQGQNAGESVVVANDGRLQNVFVYLKGGFTFTPPVNPVIVEQHGCRYVPHVVAVAVSQPVEFRNSDATIHNIHGMPKVNNAWNVSQAVRAPAITRRFSHPETMLRVQCNQHPWMNMYINVSDSPFFAVTDAQGHFELNGIPPGTYDLVFVHESLGKQTRSVTVSVREQKSVEVSFRK